MNANAFGAFLVVLILGITLLAFGLGAGRRDQSHTCFDQDNMTKVAC